MLGNCKNLVHLLLENINVRPTKKALWVKKQGIYTSMTYLDWFEQVKWFALGLEQLGVSDDSLVAILSSNRPEWVISDMGIMSVGGVVVPIYSTLAAPEIQYILNDCRAKLVIVETETQLETVLSIIDSCPEITRIVTIDRHLKTTDSRCIGFDDVQELGKSSTQTAYEDYLNHIDRIHPDQLASIVYTSGTTGTPKGVMLTHRNFLADVMDILLAIPVNDTDVVLSFLPLSHVFERTTGYYSLVAAGGSIYYAESMDAIAANILEVRPTVLISVPRLYEKMQSRILESATGVKKRLLHWALRVVQRYRHQQKIRTVSWRLRFKYFLSDRLVLSKIRQRTGGNLRFFVSGGAPLAKELGQFFDNLGLVIIEGYGLTETSPVICCNRLDGYRFGTVGKVLPSQEIRLADDGELLVRGPIVARGYLNLPNDTQIAFDPDGWFHTGDIAEIDTDGFVTIVDRKKDLIVLSNGKKVAPQQLELRLTSDELISQAIVCGENRNYLTAIVVPFIPRLRNLFPELGNLDPKSLIRHPMVLNTLSTIIDRKNNGLANFEQIKKVLFLDHELTIESGELTPSMKPRRKVIYRNYESLLQRLYDGEDLIIE
ncbi:long-chain fatty acid--CoA ligase [bacterium]|nr:long-chain fatty acid--CoA ligase [bacterium]